MKPHFLCLKHKQWFITQSDDFIEDYWLSWLETGVLHYRAKLWGKALSFVGCTFDLAHLALTRHGQNAKLACLTNRPLESTTSITRFTLSAMYLANVLEHCGYPEQAGCILTQAFQSLGKMLGEAQTECLIRECMQKLVDVKTHGDFVRRYFDLPFFACLEYKHALH